MSDLHLEYQDFNPDCINADVVVLAGDIHTGDNGVKWALKNIKEKPVIYVLGNHEYYQSTYPTLIQTLKDLTQDTHVFILENDHIRIHDVNFYGCTLWTDFRLFGDPSTAGYACQQELADFGKIKHASTNAKLRYQQTAVIHELSMHWLEKAIESGGSKNVVITHHAPSLLSIPERYKNDILSAAFASDLNTHIKALNPDIWIHGHVHETNDYTIGSTRVISNPRGYPGERNRHFDPQFMVSL